MEIRRLGLLSNPLKPESAPLITRAVDACRSAGLLPLVDPTPDDFASDRVDALLVLGGDGTILHAVGLMGERPVPILGVNLGTLGFLAECAPQELAPAIERLTTGEYHLERRMLLEARLDGESTRSLALNDVVVTRGSFARVVQVEMYVDGALATRYAGDGTVIASPTGSTAYSLSAGGPVVAPGLDGLVLAPICPHTLSSRPMVVPADAAIRVEFAKRGDDGGMLLSIDGGMSRVLHDRTVLHVRRAEQTLPFIRFSENRFFTLLRGKLSKWGGELLLEE